jgi:putative ABC transport system permease protein
VKYLPLIWNGIWRKPGRTILTALQVLVAFTLFGLLQGMKSGIDDAVSKLNADQYLVQRATGFEPLPFGLYSRILEVPGVLTATYASYLGTTYQKPSQQVLVVARDIDSAMSTIGSITVSPAALAAMRTTRTGALVSETLARKYGWKRGDRIPLESATLQQNGSRTWTFDMVDTFIPGEQTLAADFLLVNYAYFDEARKADRGTVAQYFVKVADPGRGYAVAQAIDRLFVNSSDETRTESVRESVQADLQSIGDLNFVIRAVVGAVLFALVFSIIAMMMQSIRERTPELAVLKTLGFADAAVFWLVLTEVSTLCVLAAAAGLVLAWRILPAARGFTHLNISLPASVLGAGLLLALLLAGLTAIPPALRARRLEVVQALAGH